MAKATDDQVQQIVTKVSKLVADQKTANDATATSNAAHTVLAKAQADVSASDVAEATADGIVSGDMQDLESFVRSLVTPDSATPPSISPTT